MTFGAKRSRHEQGGNDAEAARGQSVTRGGWQLAGLLLLLALPAAAESPPVFGPGFGINIKSERITPTELDLIARLGIRRVRIAFSWYQVEKHKGEHDWAVALPRHPSADDYDTGRAYSSYEIMVQQIRERGLHADITLHEGNGVWTGAPVNIAPPDQPAAYRLVAPRTPETIQAFAAFAAASVRHFQDKYGREGFTWHIWNEPDNKGGYPPEVDAGLFGALVAATCAAMRQVDPQLEIMGPALGAYGDGDLRYDFIDGMFTQANPLPCLNGFTVHPYRSAVPETAVADYAKVAAHLAPHQPKDRAPVPVAVDEWGYSINQSRGARPAAQAWRTYSGAEQAALMLRLYLTNLRARVPLTVIYDWRDRGEDPYEWEDHFGVMGFKGEEKPALRMFKAVWPALLDRALTAETVLQDCGTHEHGVRFGARQGDATEWTVLWTDGTARQLGLRGDLLRMMDIFGNDLVRDGKGVMLTGSPLLLQHRAGAAPSLRCAAQ